MPSVPPVRPRVVAMMPARNSARTLERTVNEIPPGCVDQIILVDNASKDDTVAIAERLGITVVRHPVDRGFGGSIKTLMKTGIGAGAEFLVELHPDHQYDAGDIPALLDMMGQHQYAFVMGTRFRPSIKAIRGGMPWWKFIANRTLTLFNRMMLGLPLSEFHSGLRVYSTKWLRGVPLDDLSDDFLIGFQFFGQAVFDGLPVGEIPTACRYFDDASSNPLRGSLVYGWGTLRESVSVLCARVGLGRARMRTS